MADRKEIATNRLLKLLREAEEKESSGQVGEAEESLSIDEDVLDESLRNAGDGDEDLDLDDNDVGDEPVDEEIDVDEIAEDDDEDISEDLLNYIFEEPSEVERAKVGQNHEDVGESTEELAEDASEEVDGFTEGLDLGNSYEFQDDSEEGDELEIETEVPEKSGQEDKSDEPESIDLELDEDTLRDSVGDTGEESLDFDFEDFVSGDEIAPDDVEIISESEESDPEQPKSAPVDEVEDRAAVSEEPADHESGKEPGFAGTRQAEDDRENLEEETPPSAAEVDTEQEAEHDYEELSVEDLDEAEKSALSSEAVTDAQDPQDEGFDFEVEDQVVDEEDEAPLEFADDEFATGDETGVKAFEEIANITHDPSRETESVNEEPDETNILGKIRHALAQYNIPEKLKTWLDLPDLRHITSIIPVQKTCVGIDISEYSLKYVKITKGKVPTIDEYRFETFPADMIDNPLKRKEHVEAVLHDLLSKDGMLQSYVHTTVISSEVSIRNIALPKVSKSEMDTAVQWSSKKTLPMDVDDAVIDYKVVGEIEESGVEKKDVLVVAALKKDIDSQVRFWENFDLIPNKISLPPIAAWNAYRYFGPQTDDENVMVIEVGANSSFICIIKNRNLRFVRMIGVADQDFTDALTGNISTGESRTKITRNMANRLKAEYGIPSADASGTTDEGISYSQLASRLRVPLERLAKEIQRSYSYYRKEISEGQVTKILLSGDAARIKNLSSYLEKELKSTGGMDIPLETMNPTESVEFGEEMNDPEHFAEIAPAFSVPLGLATDQSSLLNMLPKRYKDLPKYAMTKIGTLILGIIMAISMITMSAVTNAKIDNHQEQLNALRQEYAQIDPQRKGYLSAMDRKEQLVQQLNQLKKEIQFASIDARPLQTFSEIIPASFGVEYLDIKMGENNDRLLFTLSGNIYARVTSTDIELIKFVQKMESTGYFSDIEIEKTKKFDDPEQSGMFFELTFSTR